MEAPLVAERMRRKLMQTTMNLTKLADVMTNDDCFRCH